MSEQETASRPPEAPWREGEERYGDGSELIDDAWGAEAEAEAEGTPERRPGSGAERPSPPSAGPPRLWNIQIGNGNIFRVQYGQCGDTSDIMDPSEEDRAMEAVENAQQNRSMSAERRRYITIPQAAALSGRSRKAIHANLRRIEHIVSEPDAAVGLTPPPEEGTYRAILLDLASFQAWDTVAPRTVGRPRVRPVDQ